jgi:hypothetical protein
MENLQLASRSKTDGRPKRTPDRRHEAEAAAPRGAADGELSPRGRTRDTIVAPAVRAVMSSSTMPEKTKLGVHCKVARPGVMVVSLTEQDVREFGGSSESPDFNRALVAATIATVPATDPDGLDKRIAAACAALAAFKPVDEIEGMIAAQAVALHTACMECFRKALIAGQPFEVTSKLRRDGANMARGFADMLDALDRKRGKGPQVVRVERVVVHEGGQAIVGTVAAAAGIHGRGEGGSGV